jgi:predicted Zn-dependent protease
VPAINYDYAIKVMVPVLTKNNDRKQGGQTTFKLGWTVTQQAKTKASILARVAGERDSASVASSQVKPKTKWSKKQLKVQLRQASRPEDVPTDPMVEYFKRKKREARDAGAVQQSESGVDLDPIILYQQK